MTHEQIEVYKDDVAERAAAELLANRDLRLPLDFGLGVAISVIGCLQVSLRHPGDNGASAEAARTVIDGVIAWFERSGLPAISEALRLADNRSYDEPRSGDGPEKAEARLRADVDRLQRAEKRAAHEGALDQLQACGRLADFLSHTDVPLAKPGSTYNDGYRHAAKNVANAIWARRKRLVAGEPEPELAALPAAGETGSQ